MTTLIDWVESQAQENLKFRISCLDTILKDCNTTLTILLAGVGVTAAYAFKLLDSKSSETWLLFGVLGVCLYFLVLSGVLLYNCLSIEEIQVPTNEPKNLYQIQFTVLEMREGELKNIQSRIDKAATRNSKVADWLNIVRLLIILSPFIFVISMVVGSCF